MKFTQSKKLLFQLLFIYKIVNSQLSKHPIFKCEHNSYAERHPLPNRIVKHDETYKRRIDGESEFEDFNIYLDFTNLEADMKTYGLLDKKDFYETSMQNAVNILTTLLKVKPLVIGEGNTGYNIKNEDFKTININYWDKDKFGDEAISRRKTFQSQNIHLAIFGTITDLPISTLATASARVYQSGNGQPYIGVVTINKNIDYSKPNSDLYFKSILVHEFTHILGFSRFFFETYYHNIYTAEDKYGINRIYLNSSKLLAVAKKYFNCNDIQGVELEDQGGEGTAGSHWEARILLGEYMNGFAYTEEQVISEFTLAVLEDSGYYKANYYTGGLMRYGKHKGCAFLKDKCLNSYKINPNFENEFFDTLSDGNSIEASCSSGRQSRTYNAFWEIKNISEKYQYFEEPDIGGYEPADYCPVPHNYNTEEEQSFFSGHCSIKGSGYYGSMIYYADNFDPSSKNVNKYTGEILSGNSFCYLSSISKNDLVANVVRANCYETFCSNRSLTIKIFEDYIVCPRAGGKIIIEGYNGYFLCPDYNLICSGSVICNNFFDCVDKKSEIKEESYVYDYTIKTSQNIEKSNFVEIDDNDNYELSENGKCPQYCKHCQENKICLRCAEGFGRKLETDKSIKCYELEEFIEGYYQNDEEVYIKCIDNCIICIDAKSCGKCANKFFYSNNKCVKMPEGMETIENCLQYNNEGVCTKCEYGYGFNQDDKNNCLKIEEYFLNHYTKDEISYFPCSSKNNNCTKCYYNKTEFRVVCTLCVNNLIILDKGNGQCVKREEILENEKYYLINSTHAGICSKDIENCLQCDSAFNCLKCKGIYEFDEILNKCIDKRKSKKNENSENIDDESDEDYNSNNKKEKNRKINLGSNYFSIINIILLQIIYFLFLLNNI